VVLNGFWRKNLVYTSTAGTIRETSFYEIAVKIPPTMIIKLQVLTCLLQKVVLYMRILCVTLLQISKLKYVNFIIWIKIVLLTLRTDIKENIITLYCRKCDLDFATQDEYKLNPDELTHRVLYIQVLLINKLTNILKVFYSYGTEIYIIQVGKSILN
jgi:hypothetical protein